MLNVLQAMPSLQSCRHVVKSTHSRSQLQYPVVSLTSSTSKLAVRAAAEPSAAVWLSRPLKKVWRLSLLRSSQLRFSSTATRRVHCARTTLSRCPAHLHVQHTQQLRTWAQPACRRQAPEHVCEELSLQLSPPRRVQGQPLLQHCAPQQQCSLHGAQRPQCMSTAAAALSRSSEHLELGYGALRALQHRLTNLDPINPAERLKAHQSLLSSAGIGALH